MLLSNVRTMNSYTLDGDEPIYRYGSYNAHNLTPRLTDTDGLSLSTISKKKSVVTTINKINSTGILCAKQDRVNHISVVPCNDTMQNWIIQVEDSIYTKAMMSVSIKWSGE